MATVRAIALKGESVRPLREQVRGHLSNSAQGEERYAAVSMNPARFFIFELRGEAKKQLGMPDEAFLRMVFGEWEKSKMVRLVGWNRRPW